MTTPRRRRRIAVGASGSIGTLLADTRQAIQDAERAAAKAEADAKKSAGLRLKQAQQVASNYIKDGSLTYEEAKKQLDTMLSEETDSEAKMYISDYITDLKTTRDTRDVNNLSEDYTYGRISYDQFRERAAAKMSGVTNELIKQAIAKNMDAARVTENQRLVSKWSSDYSSGRLPYAEYSQKLQGLKSDPSQKSPAELDKIQATIDAAQLNEQSLEDNKAYLAYQRDPSSAATALAYFNKRLAESKNPQDANRVEQYIKSIQGAEQAKGASRAGATLTQMSAAAAEMAKNYEDTVFKPALVAAGNDPVAVHNVYSAKGEFYRTNLVPVAGTHAPMYMQVVAQTSQAAGIAASNAAYNKAQGDIKQLKADIEKQKSAKDVTVDRAFLAAKLKEIAAVASRAETSPWLISEGQISEFVALRKDAAGQLSKLAQDAMAERDAALAAGPTLEDKVADAKAREALRKGGMSPADITATLAAEGLRRNQVRASEVSRLAQETSAYMLAAQRGAFPSDMNRKKNPGWDNIDATQDTQSTYIPSWPLNRNMDLSQIQEFESGGSAPAAPKTFAPLDPMQSLSAEDFRGPQPEVPGVTAMGPTGWEAPTIDNSLGGPSFITQLPASFTPPPLVDPTIPQFEMPVISGPIDTASEDKREQNRLTR